MSRPPPPAASREARLAQALRDNLRRRKAPAASPHAPELGAPPSDAPAPAAGDEPHARS